MNFFYQPHLSKNPFVTISKRTLKLQPSFAGSWKEELHYLFFTKNHPVKLLCKSKLKDIMS